MKPKPNPITQARVDSADLEALAKAKADAAELTLERWHTMLVAAGVLDVRMKLEDNGITIKLRGIVGRRTVEVDVFAPKGQPFPLYCMIALHDFESVQAGNHPAPLVSEPVFEATTTAEGEIDHVSIEAVVDVTPPKCAHDIADEPPPMQPAGRCIVPPADRAAEIAKRSKPVDISKPPPAGAGKRRPLSLPLCKQCEAQPVYTSGAEFCGAECSKAWHMSNAVRAMGRGSKR